MRAEKVEPPTGLGGSQEGAGMRSSHRSLQEHELLARAFEPCGTDYLGNDVALHVCGRRAGHQGEHFPRPDPQNGYVDSEFPLCAACGEDITDRASDGTIGFIRVGEDWYHLSHAPVYPPGQPPDPDEDVEAWHEAEEAAAQPDADRLTSEPDYMGGER